MSVSDQKQQLHKIVKLDCFNLFLKKKKKKASGIVKNPTKKKEIRKSEMLRTRKGCADHTHCTAQKEPWAVTSCPDPCSHPDWDPTSHQPSLGSAAFSEELQVSCVHAAAPQRRNRSACARGRNNC